MSTSTLYYSETGVEVHCGRVEDVLATIDPKTVDMLSADPPYGINFNPERGRGSKSSTKSADGVYGKKWPKVEGDNKPFDPAQLLAMNRPTVLWGANNFASRLPDSGGWIVWDKKRGGTTGKGHHSSDCELAWTNIGRSVKTFSYFWDGFRRAGEVGLHLHPCQKPAALYSWLFAWRTKPGDLIVAPYAGSGPDVLAARNLGRRIIAIECVEGYCETIKQRLVNAPILPAFAPPPIETTPAQRTFFGAA